MPPLMRSRTRDARLFYVQCCPTALSVDPGADASRLRALRDALGVSRERVAVRAGVSMGTVRNAERGTHRTTLANKRAIASALGLDVTTIWPDEMGWLMTSTTLDQVTRSVADAYAAVWSSSRGCLCPAQSLPRAGPSVAVAERTSIGGRGKFEGPVRVVWWGKCRWHGGCRES